MSQAESAARNQDEEFRSLGRDFPELIGRLEYRAMHAKANGANITGGLHAEAAAAIRELCDALSEDRQLRWQLRQRLDAALAREAKYVGRNIEQGEEGDLDA